MVFYRNRSFVEFSLSKLLQEERFKIHFDGYRRPLVVIWAIYYRSYKILFRSEVSFVHRSCPCI